MSVFVYSVKYYALSVFPIGKTALLKDMRNQKSGSFHTIVYIFLFLRFHSYRKEKFRIPRP
jgi:hypothetical protein